MVRLDLMAKKTQWPQEPPQYPKGMNCEQHTSDPRFACKMAACAIQVRVLDAYGNEREYRGTTVVPKCSCSVCLMIFGMVQHVVDMPASPMTR